MISIQADLTTARAAQPSVSPGLLTRGHIGTSMTVLRDLFGDPTETADSGLGTWLVDTPAGPARLDASTGTFTDTGRWLIMAVTDQVLPWIYKLVTGSTAGYPDAAPEYFSEATLATFTAAYADYLHLRMCADREAASHVVDFEERRRTRRRASQLNTMATEVRQVLYHYEWSQATEAERTAWAGLTRPAPRAGQDPVARWHEVGRWLYSPIARLVYPHGGNPDLAGMLTGLADTAAEFRAELVERTPNVEVDLFDEHTATLRALAGATIRGLDTLSQRTR